MPRPVACAPSASLSHKDPPYAHKPLHSYVAFLFKGMADFVKRQNLAKSIGKVRGWLC